MNGINLLQAYRNISARVDHIELTLGARQMLLWELLRWHAVGIQIVPESWFL